MPSVPTPSLTPREMLLAWSRILRGYAPMLSIEITRECPLSCPGCYAYGDAHLGGEVNLRDLSDFRGERLVNGILELVRKHKPLHVSLVGGEPLVRHRELNDVLPKLSELGIFVMVVTSGVIPVPAVWMKIPRLRVAVSVDGLPEHHDIRRKPATYARILKNIEDREVNVHWVITRPMLQDEKYLEQYVSFWSERSEVNRIWVSLYTPQIGEQSPEMLTAENRLTLARELPGLASRYPKLLMNQGVADAFVHAPKSPADCVFSKLSVNYSADLRSRVEPCVFGGSPDCTQCGCAISSGLHWIRGVAVAGPLKVDHFISSSVKAGRLVNRFREQPSPPPRWEKGWLASAKPSEVEELVQIQR